MAIKNLWNYVILPSLLFRSSLNGIEYPSIRYCEVEKKSSSFVSPTINRSNLLLIVQDNISHLLLKELISKWSIKVFFGIFFAIYITMQCFHHDLYFNSILLGLKNMFIWRRIYRQGFKIRYNWKMLRFINKFYFW